MHLPEIQVIRQKMINALEEPDAENVLRGDYVCHLDIPEETPIGFDTHFTICGEEESPAYLVVIKRIDL